jgi:hypothetical protein
MIEFVLGCDQEVILIMGPELNLPLKHPESLLPKCLDI